MLNVSDMGSAKDQGFKSFASISYCTLLGPVCIVYFTNNNGHSKLNRLHHKSLFMKCQLGNCENLWLFMLAYCWPKPRESGSHPNLRGKHLL